LQYGQPSTIAVLPDHSRILRYRCFRLGITSCESISLLAIFRTPDTKAHCERAADSIRTDLHSADIYLLPQSSSKSALPLGARSSTRSAAVWLTRSYCCLCTTSKDASATTLLLAI